MPQQDNNALAETMRTFKIGPEAFRTLLRDGEPWFVLTDLCKMLGMRSSGAVSDTAGRLDDDQKDGIALDDTIGRKQQTIIVSESGMYDVIIRSNAPAGKILRKWITSKILPELRKTGAYSIDGQPQAAVIDAATVRMLVEQNGDLMKLLGIATAQNGQLVTALCEQRMQPVLAGAPAAAEPVTIAFVKADVPTAELTSVQAYTARGWLTHVMGLRDTHWAYRKALGLRAGKLARQRGVTADKSGASYYGATNKWPGWLWADAYRELPAPDVYAAQYEAKRAAS